ncbi:MAG TPA: SpoIIE family protein phosphatase [Candidatus Cybelea sp.]|jgi:serine phosphatase RsbU (regulator of sigma subunit)|nr:SpoIIE family protein phosphatase [Candidatus Cybelea sp.]
MSRRLPAPLILTLAFLLLTVGVLVAGGIFVRSLLADSVANGERIRTARTFVSGAVTAQLGEETGVRGYAAARDPVLLEPYYAGRANLPVLLRQVRSVAQSLGLREALPFIADATATNRRWLAQSAFPLFTARKRSHVLELRGKVLVDRFRADMAAVDRALVRREQLGDASAERAIVWVDSFALVAVLAVILAAALFAVQQYRLGMRLERELVATERQRRQSAEMRAAYEAEKRIADTLQEAFLQRILPELATVRLSAAYLPATEEAKVGGDWYDALELPQDRILLAIGDVAGHGIEAAVAMNKARQMLISCALIDPSPASVLERVNAELVADKSPMITAVAGVVDARTCRFSYAAAGHPAPVLLEPGRRARFLDIGSLPLGVSADTKYVTHQIQSAPGAMLVLYTDGVIEHSHDVLEGEHLLLAAVESAAQTAQTDPAKAIRDEIFRHHRISDDAAIVTVHFLDAAAAGASDARALRWSA